VVSEIEFGPFEGLQVVYVHVVLLETLPWCEMEVTSDLQMCKNRERKF
jgi:hypothetical protein